MNPSSAISRKPNSSASFVAAVLALACAFVTSPVAWAAKPAPPPPAFPDRPVAYVRDVVPEVPWAIHVVRIARRTPGLAFETTLGSGDRLGMGTVTDQLKGLPREAGRPVAAINGDFYDQVRGVPGRPRDLQIHRGEVVSAPAGHACLWFDRDGTPHATNVTSSFRVRWSNGATTPIGLNQDRKDDALVLYTAAAGPATRTGGGTELILEAVPGSDWLPLRIGRAHTARVRAAQPAGDAPLPPGTAVLSVGPALAPTLPAIEPGVTRLELLTETAPALVDVDTAIGGGPMLVHEGRAAQWNGLIQPRHPRTAFGWNDQHLFLVQVDGRQEDISVGMTLQEFADYLARLGCREAINFDGGGSATLWALGNVQNSPSEGQERPGPNSLVVVRRSAAP